MVEVEGRRGCGGMGSGSGEGANAGVKGRVARLWRRC